ncbi:MAG: iron chelate uptake ABC transporter family permease subunit [Phycisphaerales bacterium]|nr:iron chelate uptake ABC transporter family permease subunit [Phycisphaerales bacterium]
MSDPIVDANSIIETLTLQGGFNTNAVILGTSLLGVAAGVIGAFALLRKRSLTADALSHATLPGIAAAFLISSALGFSGRSMPVLMLGAAISGILGVACIHLILQHTRLKEDAAIGIVLSVFFGVGIVLLSVVQSSTSGSAAGLNHYIYGQTAAMIRSDAYLMGGIGIIASLIALIMLKEFMVVCFNESFARSMGMPVWLIDSIMLALVVLITVAGLQAVGLILIVAMLIIPPAAARFWTDRLWKLVLFSALIGGLSGYSGATISALFPRKPAGSVIVLVAGSIFILSMLFAPTRGVLADTIRRIRLRVRIARDHVLESLYEIEIGHVGIEHPKAASWLIQLLCFKGWIERNNGKLNLTETGRTQGQRIHRNHLLWEQYLVSYADIAPTHVDWSVDQVEHVLSDELIHALVLALKKRGLTIPPLDGGTS